MTLGESIFQLRIKRGWSQDILAEKLGVSRQSISKWETDSSVPELDKLICLSSVFEVSIDDLVHGRIDGESPAAAPAMPAVSPPPEAPRRAVGHPVAALILLCTGALVFLVVSFLGGLLGGLIFAAPFWVCSLISATVGRHAGLYCAWVVYFFVDGYMRFATGISWSALFSLLLVGKLNMPRLIVSFLQLAVMVTLVIVTLYGKRDKEVELTRRFWWSFGGLWAAFVVTYLLPSPLFRLLMGEGSGEIIVEPNPMRLIQMLINGINYLNLVLFVVALHYSIAAVRARRRKGKHGSPDGE